MPLDQPPWSFGDLLGPLLLALIVIAIAADRVRARRRGRPVKDIGDPYRVHAREWDLELPAAQVPVRLADASPDLYNRHATGGGTEWQAARRHAERWSERQPDPSELAAPIADALKTSGVGPADISITLLVDQSGSMKGEPIWATAAALGALSDTLGGMGIAHEILGYSTAGWHGGYPYRQWCKTRRPKRPGRLCALLHIIYKAADEPRWSDDSRAAFLHPDILRENIDGEALEWAAGRAQGSTVRRRLLVQLSDGAPVDDATLMHNGGTYLERHLLETIAAIGKAGDVALGAIGIGYEIHRYYPVSRKAEVGQIAPQTAALIADLIRAPA